MSRQILVTVSPPAFRARDSDRTPARYGARRAIADRPELFTMPSSAGVRLERPH